MLYPPLFFLGWFLLALFFSAAGLLTWFGPPFPQVVIVVLTLLVTALFFRVKDYRRAALSIDRNYILAIHLTRFIGLYFLVLYEDRKLPWDFAVPGGWGDVVVASSALILILYARVGRRVSEPYYWAWNILGLLDLVYVVATAAVLGLQSPSSMRILMELPLALLPTFLVPILIGSHIFLFYRFIRKRASR